MKLTDSTVRAASCPAGAKDVLIFDGKLPGFALRVTAGGNRVFLYQYRIGGQRRRMVIGEWGVGDMTAARGRRRAEELRGAVRSGRDPWSEIKAAQQAARAAEVAAKRGAAEAAYTIRVMIQQWQELHLAERRASYREHAPKRVCEALQKWLDTPAATFSRVDAVRVLDAVKASRGPIAANRVRAYAGACFGWARKRNAISENPFAGLAKPSDERPRERTLSDSELARIWHAAPKLPAPHGDLIRLLILTGQRRSEVAGIRWSEIDEESGVWTIPAERVKNGRRHGSHSVPLSRLARDLIAELPRLDGCDFVLPTSAAKAPVSYSRSKALLDAATAEDGGLPMAPWTLHDIRRSVATGLQRLGVRLEVTERVLNHLTGTRTGIVAVYQRHAWTTETRAALDAWGAHVTKIVNERTLVNVVSIAAVRESRGNAGS
jgi:integrase